MLNKQITAVYGAGLVQGIALITFPAAGSIFTSPLEYGFSSVEYGTLFIPQAALSIASSAISPKLTRMIGGKIVFVAGIAMNLASMSLLLLSAAIMSYSAAALVILLCATSALGIGFGLTVPTLNNMTALLLPQGVDKAILLLNALLGLGTALAPFFTAIFAALGFWWGLPILMVILLTTLIVYSLPLSLPGGKIDVVPVKKIKNYPLSGFWLFAMFALLYGIIETLNGNWVSIYMSTVQKAAIVIQSMALMAFWGLVTLGRIFFALASRLFPPRMAFQFLPFVAAAAFLYLTVLPSGYPYAGIIAFALSGCGCSALLPLVISLGNTQLQAHGAASGGIIAFYLLGYGIAAFGVGPLEEIARMNLSEVYSLGIVIAVGLGCVSYLINVRSKEEIA